MRYLHWWHGNPAGAAQSLSSHLSPAVIAGRENERHQFELALAEGPGNPWRTALISGSRGIGKAVLLNELEDVAQAQGWLVLRAHVGPRMLLDLVEVTIPRVYDTLDDAPTPRRRTLTGVSLSHLGSVSMAAERTRPLPGRNLLSELQDLAEVTAPRAWGSGRRGGDGFHHHERLPPAPRADLSGADRGPFAGKGAICAAVYGGVFERAHQVVFPGKGGVRPL